MARHPRQAALWCALVLLAWLAPTGAAAQGYGNARDPIAGQASGDEQDVQKAKPREPKGQPSSEAPKARPRTESSKTESRKEASEAQPLGEPPKAKPRAEAPHPEARGEAHRPPPPRWPVRGNVVFVGGYFYDPFFGPYPWWSPSTYPHWYFPVFDHRAEVRVIATPREAAVYVDGFYAGIADDFDGFFQALPLPPGGHRITLYLEGYRTVQDNVYLRPGSTLKLHRTMERLPAGVVSEPPPLVPPVPPPPDGTYTSPRAGARPRTTPALPATEDEGTTEFGMLDLCVDPVTAEVEIDGERWVTAEDGHYVVHVPTGQHRVEVFENGQRRFSAEVRIRKGETTPLDINIR